MQKFKITVPLYRTSVHVLIGLSDEENKKYYKRFGGEYLNHAVLDETSEARAICDKSGLTFVILKDNPDLSVVAHELLHCVFYILDRAGLSLNGGSEEAYTYLMGYLMKEFLHKTNNTI